MDYFREIMNDIGAIGVHFEEMMPEIMIKALTDFPVLITGETGTGKELVAKLVHKMSKRSDKPFQFVNVTAINGGLFESELFGHKKGAFTDASSARKGIILEVDGGTIVLDEIGDMSLETQSKILRWLESGEIKPVGSDKLVFVDTRIIASTNKNLEILVEKELFRRDLYYRLSSLSIKVLPLRRNQEAILDLAKYFIDKNKGCFFNFNGDSLREPSGSELAKLFSELVEANYYSDNFLSGNARELESIIRGWLFKQAYQNKEVISISNSHSKIDAEIDAESEKKELEYSEMPKCPIAKNAYKALILCKGDTLNASMLLECLEDDLLEIIQCYGIRISDDDFNVSISRNEIQPLKSFFKEEGAKLEELEWLKEIRCNFSSPSDDDLKKIRRLLEENLEMVEKQTIQTAIDYHNGNLKDVCASLEIGYKKLKSNIIKYGIVASGVREEANRGPLKEVLKIVLCNLIKFLMERGMAVKNIAYATNLSVPTVYLKIKEGNLK